MRAKQLIKMLETDHPEGMSHAELFLANEDLLPVTEEKKTWDGWSFVAFWIADSFNLNTFTIASGMIAAGLNWWQAFICVIIGYTLVGPLLVLNARPGAVFGITFPAVNRCTFGLFGSLWPVFNRAGMACIWWGVQAWLGGECVYVLLRAIWPSFAKIPNQMSASSETSTAYVVAFFLYWLLSLPVTWIPIHKLRYPFFVKAIVGPIVGFTLFGWSVTRAGGTGPVLSQPATKSGSELGWQMVISISAVFGNMWTLITNAPDFASRAKRPSAAVWPQLIAMPIGFSITSFLGIIIASASVPQFGHQIWDVVQLMDAMLDDNPTAATRAGLVFISAGFIYVQLMLNVAANSISAGCDLTALFPRFINIRRGGYIACIIGLAMNPWLLFKSSATFTNYLGAYGVLLSCIAGPMICQYWIVSRGHVRVADLYNTDPKGWYWYSFGVNWRAYLAYICGFAINLPGFISALNPAINTGVAASRIYSLSWITGSGVSMLVYYVACRVSPPLSFSKGFKEVDESASEVLYRDDHEQSRNEGSATPEEKDESIFKKQTTAVQILDA